ncbi:cation diffusion facilitator family transporter [Roseivivax sediminis]|uniref:Cobalt-zinc-cadmium efflux system protein n=1 Tax=Roseivivax sediminis TaxID=936889 RepID=A0A1I2C507_9RHOB|nr:cation diffusion facilitator family transporter [Roseivivax sediminis]SFE63427.1 cobalt-zinc-cadmium efflux system protein [Roseivivax sediminis]
MPHDHHHAHVGPEAGDRRVAAAVGVNLLLTVVQIVGGLLSGSLAMIADAIHNLSDAASLVIAFVARRIARRPADAAMTFGYGRAEVVAALVNYTTLVLIGLYLVYEAVLRIFAPEPVTGWLVVVIAAVALVVDLATAALTWAMSKDSMNIRAAFLHNLADALGSVAVIAAGTLILLFGWTWVDPVVTLAIAGYILWMSLSEMPGVIRILMLGAPPQIDAEAVVEAARTVPGVAEIHHAHLWQMQEHAASFEAHVVVAPGAWDRADAIKAAVKERLRERFGIAHSTLEMECSAHACADVQVFGAA